MGLQSLFVYYTVSKLEYSQVTATMESALREVLPSAKPTIIPVNAVGSTTQADAIVLIEATVLPNGPFERPARI